MLSTVGLICLHLVARRRRPPSVARCRVGTREQWRYDLDAWHDMRDENDKLACADCPACDQQWAFDSIRGISFYLFTIFFPRNLSAFGI